MTFLSVAGIIGTTALLDRGRPRLARQSDQSGRGVSQRRMNGRRSKQPSACATRQNTGGDQWLGSTVGSRTAAATADTPCARWFRTPSLHADGGPVPRPRHRRQRRHFLARRSGAAAHCCPCRDPHRLVLIDWRGNALADGWGSGNLMSYPMCRDLQAQTQFFDGVLCRHPTTVNLSTGGERRARSLAEIVSGTYFPVLGVTAAPRPPHRRIGRPRDSDAHPVVGASRTTIWANALGRAPRYRRPQGPRQQPSDDRNRRRRASVSAGWTSAKRRRCGCPAMMKRQVTPGWDRLLDRRARWMHVFGRLKPGVTAESAQGRTPAVVQVGARVRSAARRVFRQTTPEQLRSFPRVLSRRDAGLAWTIEHAAGDENGPLWVLLAGDVTPGAARVLERREPAPCAWRRARTRGGHAHRARRVSRPD